MIYSKTITLALTGASGSQYALRLLQCLVAAKCRVYLLISRAATVVMNTETSHVMPLSTADQQQFFESFANAAPGQLLMFDKEDWFSPVASGSNAPDAMVICPASGGTIAAVAMGASNNLIERAADVMIKERRPLIVVPRETPLSTIHLQNMLTLSQNGCIVLPASPGFYHNPEKIDDLIDFIVARILDQLQLGHELMPRWGDIDAEQRN